MANDLYCATARAAAKSVEGRQAGEQRVLICWIILGGGNEQAQIKQQLANNGWDVLEFRDGKPVSSADDGGDPIIRAAMAEVRQNGFVFLVHSRPPL